ncbi:MAG: hypothetical protein LBR52_04855 [Prevotellaceae bacterium]|jgi:hypothetical protein|nr:hypothetical protein [Prevotellaceae bacterium]
MRKVLFIVAAMGMITLASCSKEKDCTCTTKTTGSPVEMPDVTSEGTVKDGDCNDLNSSTEMGGVKVETTCKEK